MYLWYLMMTKACTDTDCEFISSCTVQVSLAVLIKNIKYMNPLKLCRNIPGKRHKCTILVGNLGPGQYKDAILSV